MEILVTGGAGFIGSNFILYWMKKYPKDKIINLDNLTYAGNLENLKLVEKNKNYKFVKGDICDPKVVNRAMKGVDVVIHLAAESHVDRSILGPAIFVHSNVEGTRVLLDVALQNKIKRFHHVSTDEVFGQLKLTDKHGFNEKTIYNPRNPYSASKAASDHLVRAYYHTFGLPITITNTANNYRFYQFPEKLIPLAISNLVEGKKVPIYGDGKYVRDWLYVDDHCRGIELVLKKGKIGETYCIGGMTKDINNLELIKKLLKIMGKDESCMEFVKDRPGHDRRYAIDWRKAKRELGYRPKHDLDTYLKKTVKWYLNNEDWWKRVKSGAYKRYYQKQYGR